MVHPLLAALLLPSLGLTPPVPSLPHTIVFAEAPDVAKGYDHKWAVIVGVNYAKQLQLKRAEDDAQAVKDLLVEHFGYDDKHVVLLKGEAATKQAVENALADGLGKAGPRDSILFFFAGHGARTKAGGVLFPCDVQIDAAGLPTSSALRMEEDVVSRLRESPALHKLLILDCCSAGAVLQTDGRRAANDGAAEGDAFSSPAFQALVSCRDTQEASDGGKNGHSPFTYALLQGLKTIPIQRKDNRPFTVRGMFGAMGGYLAGLKRDQTPQCQWLDAGQGEFHFYPEGTFEIADRDEAAMERMLVAMVPGTFGNWWFDETPWLMPGIRYEVLNRLPAARSARIDWISKGSLERAAEDMAKGLGADPDPKVQMRIRHLNKLLGVRGKEEFAAVLADIESDLEKQEVDDPKDLHFLAVLKHVRKEPGAAAAYEKALNCYEAAALEDPTLRPLQALCLTDLGWYYLNQANDFNKAATCFAEAQCVYPAAPPPFRIFSLCWESDSWMRLGSWKAADAKLDEALKISRGVEGVGADPLNAAVHNRRGWSFMERWRIQDAVVEFDASTDILDKIIAADPSDLNAVVLRYHNRHGKAMAQRFLGNTPESLKEYVTLINEIKKNRRDLRTNADGDVDFKETRGRLAERVVNSLERLADCNLFGDPADLTQAAVDYEQAVLACESLSVDRESTAVANLKYKEALALALPSRAQDLDLAAALVQEAQKRVKEPSGRLKLLADLAQAVVACLSKPDGKALALASLREAIEGRKKSLGSDIPRDDLESLLFAYKVLIQLSIPSEGAKLAEDSGGQAATFSAQSLDGAERLQTMEDVDQMLLLCRRVVVWGGNKKELLPYLRRYYDAGIRADLALRPSHVKKLVATACEAMEGTPYARQENPRPVLVLYALGDQCHLFLDVPHGVSKDYVVEDESLDQVRDASRTGQRLRPPPALKKQLDLLRDPLEVRWEDPVCLCHICPSSSLFTSGAGAGDGGTPVAVRQEEAPWVFPFDLPGVKLLDPPAKVAADVDPPKPMPKVAEGDPK